MSHNVPKYRLPSFLFSFLVIVVGIHPSVPEYPLLHVIKCASHETAVPLFFPFLRVSHPLYVKHVCIRALPLNHHVFLTVNSG